MHAAQATGANPFRERRGRQSTFAELVARDHAVLRTRDLRDPVVDRVN